MGEKKLVEVTCDQCGGSASFDSVDEAFDWLESHQCEELYEQSND
jgi:hypothetical protein